MTPLPLQFQKHLSEERRNVVAMNRLVKHCSFGAIHFNYFEILQEVDGLLQSGLCLWLLVFENLLNRVS